MVLDPIPQSLPVHFVGSRPQPPTSRRHPVEADTEEDRDPERDIETDNSLTNFLEIDADTDEDRDT